MRCSTAPGSPTTSTPSVPTRRWPGRSVEAITGRLLTADPDLIAVRPLLEAAAISLVSSPAFGPVVRTAARQAHRAMTNDDPTQIVLRLADLGAVLAGVLRSVAPAGRAGSRPTST